MRNLRNDTVSRLQPTPAKLIDVGRAIADGIDMMRHEKVGCLLVTRGGSLVGIFTERDLLKRVLAVGTPLAYPLAEVMTENPVSVTMKDSIRNALRKMQEGGYRHLPVIDDANHPIGILSAKRIVHYLVEHFPSAVYNQPPDQHQVPSTPHGA